MYIVHLFLRIYIYTKIHTLPKNEVCGAYLLIYIYTCSRILAVVIQPKVLDT